MTFAQLTKLFELKARAYSAAQARAAVADIDATLELYRDRDISDPYVRKLWCERDVMIERARRG